jgi:hypothetical protein
MRVGSRTAVVAFAAMIAFFQPAQAQDGSETVLSRTPDSAHEFLKDLAAKKLITFEPPNHVATYHNGWTRRSGYFSFDAPQNPMLFSIGSSERCRTIIIEPQRTNLNEKSVSRPFEEYLKKLFSNGIDWTSVTQVTLNGNRVLVFISDIGPAPMNLIFSSPELASRSFVAVDYIRQSCDSLSKTGF